MPEENSALVSLRRYFSDEQLAFMGKPFNALVAGCGTGQQAIAAAVRYGPKADVHAIDLSKASLAYAKARAEDFGLVNLRFAQADILDFADSGEGPFNIIEAVGVLHHMEKPSEGWRILAEQLRPGGLMLIGLYSVVSRRHLTELRNRSDYPGSGCDIETARQYRAALIAKRDEMAVRMTASLDFYSMNEFRDLLLHEHEQPMLLSEIEALLEDNKLTFRGFQLPSPIIAHFLQNSPGESWPGSFRAWASYEAKFPRTFDVMYNFWCEKAG
jgi:SAM-dependent methyltransferase